MTTYRYGNLAKTIVIMDGAEHITEGGRGWPEYLAWLAEGNSPDPFETQTEMAQRKTLALGVELNSRVDSLVGTSSNKDKLKTISRALKIVRKESKGNATAEEKTELDQAEALFDGVQGLYDKAEAASDWLNDGSRTAAEIEAYDITTEPWK